MSFKPYYVLLILLAGCDFFKIKEKTEPFTDSRAIARVNDHYLYESDIEGIVPKDVSGVDSANLIERYAKSWIKKQLMISEASSSIDFDELELERKILDYRYALMVHKFEEYYVNQELDTEVTEQQINRYYKDNIDNFELKQNIIRGIFIKVPKEAPKLEEVEGLLLSKSDTDKAALRSYCFRFATTYSLRDSVWLNFDEVIENTPLMDIPNKVQFLKENKYVQSSDDHYAYFLKVKEYKISDQISPLEFVRDQIINIIINKRKLALANELEEEVFNRAKKNNDFEIYTKD